MEEYVATDHRQRDFFKTEGLLEILRVASVEKTTILYGVTGNWGSWVVLLSSPVHH